ncbi:hypothetical protein L3Q82_010830 [Scortum barcoo]|uniref:Uncharacterized protein n=1 Tax=Scortum barcoo TaxID=214431 RepID=A0ACB8WA39_9TELE|nr:hypothetical protein L3Q82_010830 [Scortum barcoo]
MCHETLRDTVVGTPEGHHSPVLNPLQFAHWANRDIGSEPVSGLVDSSTFSTIISEVLCSKLTQHTLPDTACQWITGFLTDKRQQVRLEKVTSSTSTVSSGATMAFRIMI